MSGYTLIELLVVLVIIAIISLIGFVNYKSFAADQVTIKAVGQIQSILRIAQTNATSSTLCKDKGPLSWSAIFINATTIELRCDPDNFLKNTYNLEDAEVSTILGSDCGTSNSSLPFTITYSSGSGNMVLYSSGSTSTCLASNSWIFTVRNTKNNSTRNFKLSKGGAIDVQQ